MTSVASPLARPQMAGPEPGRDVLSDANHTSARHRVRGQLPVPDAELSVASDRC